MAFRRSPINRQHTSSSLKHASKFVPVVDSLERRETPAVTHVFALVTGELKFTIDNSSITTGTTHEYLRLESSDDGTQVAFYDEAGNKTFTYGLNLAPVIKVTVDIIGTNPLIRVKEQKSFCKQAVPPVLRTCHRRLSSTAAMRTTRSSAPTLTSMS